ncbi:ornithine cyclodeaminase family protein [Plantactinospora sp. WMMC1484]|uniref:ornithine cyclodeaminase family protein n=1 Tax=Plantactinospora sp. WMMC1484 TaxID=3404122 RepID=UPI003BF59208
MRVIDGATVRSILSPRELVQAMGEALADFSTGRVAQHPRVTVESTTSPGRVLIMPSASADAGMGLKVLSMFDRSAERGLPHVQGVLILLDPTYGEPLAVIDGVALTEIRTAAVTARATALLARPEASRLAVIGAGVQGRAHLAALADLRDWSRISVFSRTAERAEQLVGWARQRDLPAELSDDPDAALKDADVICTTTSSASPVVADSSIAPEGVHINGVGAFGATCRELPTALVRRAEVYVDSREAALREAGDVLVPISEGVIDASHIRAELGEVIAGRHPGRTDPRATTLFKSLGLAVEDLVAARVVYERAVERGAGVVVGAS